MRDARAAPPVSGGEPAVSQGSVWPLAMLGLILGAVLYNAVLAVASARGLNIGGAHVVAAEFGLLSLGALALLFHYRLDLDSAAIAFGAFFAVVALLMSLGTETTVVAMLRSAAIISLFVMIGHRLDARSVKRAFALATAAVVAGLALEIASPTGYVQLFEPARYFQLTRGIDPLETVGGLFRNASGFEGRFSIAQLLNHRAGSIFLEPVSLGNFGVVLTGLLLCFWGQLRARAKLLYAAVILLILVATNSRILLAFIFLAPVAYFVAPAFDRARRALVVPLILAVAALLYAFGPPAEGDNLAGRIALAMQSLEELELEGIAGGRPDLAPTFTDSGYAYVIYGSSILGLVALWLFVSLAPPDASPVQRRAGLFLCLYVAINLLISGNSLFSMKVAPLLWIMIGYVAAIHAQSREQDKAWRTGDGPARARKWRRPSRGVSPGYGAARPASGA